MFWIGWIAIYATLIQWPIYLLWVLVSKELSWKLRIVWIAIIVVGNMLAMPWFLWCKYRRRTREGVLGIFKPCVRQYLDDEYVHPMAETPAAGSDSFSTRWLPLGWKLRYLIFWGVYFGLFGMAASLAGYGWCFFYFRYGIWITFVIVAIPALFKRRTTGYGVHLAAALSQYCLSTVLIGSIAVSLWYGGMAIRRAMKIPVCHKMDVLIGKVEAFYREKGYYPASLNDLHFIAELSLNVHTNESAGMDLAGMNDHAATLYMCTNNFACVVPVTRVFADSFTRFYVYVWSSDDPQWQYQKIVWNYTFPR